MAMVTLAALIERSLAQTSPPLARGALHAWWAGVRRGCARERIGA
jgi:hypothetical protein